MRCARAKRPADVSALDLREDPAKTVAVVVDEVRVEPRLEFDEGAGQVLQQPLVYDDAGHDQNRRDPAVVRCGRQVTGVARLVYVAKPQGNLPTCNYGHPEVAVGSVA
jgi:hypothetical protein